MNAMTRDDLLTKEVNFDTIFEKKWILAPKGGNECLLKEQHLYLLIYEFYKMVGGRHMIKRTVACTLAMLMVLQSTSTYAASVGTKEQTEQLQTVVQTSTKQSAENGAIEVNVAFSKVDGEKLLANENTKLQVILLKEGKQIQEKTIQSSDLKDGVVSIVFSDLTVGEYEIQIKGNKIETYKQALTVEKLVKSRIQVEMTHFNNKAFEALESHLGTVGYGDFNEDGSIDQKDQKLLVKAIEATDNNQDYDLNGDNKVNLVDLQYLSYSIGASNLTSAVEKIAIVSTESVKVESNGATISIDGSENITEADIATALLEDTGSILTLTPSVDENGEATVISEENPVEVSLDFSDSTVKAEGLTITAPANNAIQGGTLTVTYEDENGELVTQELPIENSNSKLRSAKAAATVTINEDGSIVINLGKQVAVKRVTIQVTKTESQTLAEISKVDFVNDMASKVPAPQLSIPTVKESAGGDKKITLSWSKETNVTGYEVKVTEKGTNKTEVYSSTTSSYTVESFAPGNKGKLENYKTYEVQVRSVNGKWRSDYSEVTEVSTSPTKAPDSPEGVSITGGYQQLKITWKATEDAQSYTLYYRKKGTEEYKSMSDIKTNSYTLTELADITTYEVCLTATNHIGTSEKSRAYEGATVDATLPETTNYKLINTSNGEGETTAHITDVTYTHGVVPTNKFAIVDNSYSTGWVLNDWDAGYNYWNRAPVVTFDDVYEMNHIILIPSPNQPYDYQSHVKVVYTDENGTEKTVEGQLTKATDKVGKVYYDLWLTTPIKAKTVRLAFATGYNRKITINELKFYAYDTIEGDIEALFKDAERITLNDDVTLETITALKERLEQPDPVSGEKNPKYNILMKILEQAENIYNKKELSASIQVNTKLGSGRDGHLKFARSLNTWQPLGYVASRGEQIEIVVGSSSKSIGANSGVSLIVTQYNAEVTAWTKKVADLKVGSNIVTIPSIDNLSKEQGGNLYLNYSGAEGEQISVRILGGTKVPVLDLKGVTDETKRMELIESYMADLEQYQKEIQAKHEELHKGNADSYSDYDYSEENCILQGTDIGIERVMFSVPGSQVLKGLDAKLTKENKEITTKNRATALAAILDSADTMVNLFYNHKGLSEDKNAGSTNRMPVGRLNIRYMIMFNGAFMYAAGQHIGIGFDSVTGLFNLEDFETNEDGTYKSGNLFGWGIAHEIGHVINQGSYEVAEVTNNYYSQLAQSQDNNESYRMDYKDVYADVTSGTKGTKATNLTMYWQLHLAYDDVYNYVTYDTHKEMFDNLIYAKIDTYARNTALADSDTKTEIKLQLNGDSYNNYMRLATAATQKNLLEFFEAWGLTPDETTIAYAKQFPKETRKIQYVTDDAKAYRVKNKEKAEDIAKATEATKVTATASYKKNDSKVVLTLGTDSTDKDSLLGYEIYRNGEVVGFVDASETTFEDPIQTINNRVFNYTVVAYDKFLNATEATEVTPFKVSNDGTFSDKTNWSATSNLQKDQKETSTEHGGSIGCEDGTHHNLEKSELENIIFDGETTTEYEDTAVSGNASIIVNFNEELTVTGVKVTSKNAEKRIKDFKISVSDDGQKWTEVKTGQFAYTEDGVALTYFDKDGDQKLYTYDAGYLKIEAVGQSSISLAETDLLEPAGDNVELVDNGIGYLEKDYQYGDNAEDVIPAGSLIFTGEYKGNPAYNVVLLKDQDGNIISGQQIIFAEDPKNGQLGEISAGTWIYFITPDQLESISNVKSVMAELYRVQNAHTNEQERLVSDTLYVTMPEGKPSISLEDQNSKDSTEQTDVDSTEASEEQTTN